MTPPPSKTAFTSSRTRMTERVALLHKIGVLVIEVVDADLVEVACDIRVVS